MFNEESQKEEAIALDVGSASPRERVRRACLVRGGELSGAVREMASVLAGTAKQGPLLRTWSDEIDVWLDSLEWAVGRGTRPMPSPDPAADCSAVAEALCRMGELGVALRRFAELEAVQQRRVVALPPLATCMRAFARDLDDTLAAFAAGDVLAAGRIVSRCIENGRAFDREASLTLRALPDTWWETLPGMEANTLGEVVDVTDDVGHGVRRLVDALVVAVLLLRHTYRHASDTPRGTAAAPF